MNNKIHPFNPIPQVFDNAEAPPLNKWELQDRLSIINAKIEQEKAKNLTWTNLLTNTWQETRRPSFWGVSSKVCVIIAGAVASPALTLGAVACFTAFNVVSPRNITSKNKDTASNASGLYGNLGHGVGYMLELIEVLEEVGSLLTPNSYLTAKAKLIDESYRSVLQKEKLSKQEKAHFHKYLMPDQVFTVVAQIERIKAKNLTVANLKKHTWKELSLDFQHDQMRVISKVIVFMAGIGTLVPLTLGSFACFAVFNAAEPGEIFSEDKDVASNAVGLYANLGHGVGYLLVGREIIRVSYFQLFGSPYNRARAKLVEESYREALEGKEDLSQQDLDYLFERKEGDIIEGRPNEIPQLRMPPGMDP